MSAIHNQAMSHVHAQVLTRLSSFFTPGQRAALQLLVQRLTVAAGGAAGIGNFKVMLGCAGGKDSVQTLAFLRAAQLSIAAQQASTFSLRVATCRHSGISQAAFANILRACDALFLQGDPRVELLLVDDHRVTPLEHAEPLDQAARVKQRLNMLVSGHLTAGDERVTFGTGCYLEMARCFQRALSWQGGVDAVAMADPPRQLRHYLAWGLRAARRAADHAGRQRPVPSALLQALQELGDAYHQELHGRPPVHGMSEALQPGSPKKTEFINLHGLLDGDSADHWHLLQGFLGYEFLGQGSGLHELDGVSPLLLAHMSGLRSQFLAGRTYQRGVHDYLRVGIPLMRARGMPQLLIKRTLAAWYGDGCLLHRRAQANTQAAAAFGVDETQLVCMLFAPFVGHGAGLKRYLEHCHPHRLPWLPDLHWALQGHTSSAAVSSWLKQVSGLPPVTLQRLYHLDAVDLQGRRHLIARLSADDPQRRASKVAPSLTGHALRELLAGRA